jgi:hypothetical protein
VRFEIQRSKSMTDCYLVPSHSSQAEWDRRGTVGQRSQFSSASEMVRRRNRLIQLVLPLLVSNPRQCAKSFPVFVAGRQMNKEGNI